MLNTLKTLTEIQPARNYKNIDSLNKIAEYIKDRFEENGLETKYQEYKVLGKTYKNVIGVMNPDKEETIVIGGHYDVQGNKPGADDNATAVAGLVETSKRINPEDIDYRLEFVAFTLEEPPFFGTKKMGSYIHAKSVKDKNIVGMLNYEMIGYFSKEKGSQKYPFILKPFLKKLNIPDVGDFIAFVANKNSEEFMNKLRIDDVETRIRYLDVIVPNFFAKSTASDHINYWKFGIPAVMITDTAFHRNPNYHKKTDTLDTLNLEEMEKVIEMTVNIIKNYK